MARMQALMPMPNATAMRIAICFFSSTIKTLLELDCRGGADCLFKLKVGEFGQSEQTGYDIGGDDITEGVVLLRDIVVGIPLPGNLFLHTPDGFHKVHDRRIGLEVGIVLGNGKEPPEDGP